MKSPLYIGRSALKSLLCKLKKWTSTDAILPGDSIAQHILDTQCRKLRHGEDPVPLSVAVATLRNSLLELSQRNMDQLRLISDMSTEISILRARIEEDEEAMKRLTDSVEAGLALRDLGEQ